MAHASSVLHTHVILMHQRYRETETEGRHAIAIPRFAI